MSNLIFAYMRVSTKSQDFTSQLEEIKQSYPTAKIHEEKISGTVPANERPVMSALLGKLRAGDTLVVWWVDRLGRSYHEIESLMRDLLKSGVIIKTINQNMTFEYTGDDMKDLTTNIMLSMLTAMAAAERKNRLASARAGIDAILKDEDLKAEKYKGRKANTDMHEKIITLLNQGQSIRAIAKELKVSTNTVQRVKKAQLV